MLIAMVLFDGQQASEYSPDEKKKKKKGGWGLGWAVFVDRLQHISGTYGFGILMRGKKMAGC